MATNALGRYYRDVSLFDKSLYEYNNALLISRKKKDTILEIKTLNAIGSVYRRQDDIKNALIYHQEALDKATTIKNP
jgi:tetratricopeptide (TPR) repeat protein